MAIASVPQLSRSRYYVGMAAFMSLVVLVGFWPSYFSQVLHGIPDRPWFLHLHGLIYVGWMVLLIAQVMLVVTGRVRAHRTLGNFGIAYGFLVLAMGLFVTVAAPVTHVAKGEQTVDQAAGFIVIPLGDMILFAGFFIPAVIYRRRPELHKRLIVLATTALLFAAAGRMEFLLPTVGALVVWLSPVLAGMAYDKWSRGKVHPVYFVGLLALAIGLSRLALTTSELWLPIGRAIIRTFSEARI